MVETLPVTGGRGRQAGTVTCGYLRGCRPTRPTPRAVVARATSGGRAAPARRRIVSAMGVDSGRRWQPAATAVGVAVLVVISAVTAPPARIRLDLFSSALLVVPALATAFRHRFPLAVLSLATT